MAILVAAAAAIVFASGAAVLVRTVRRGSGAHRQPEPGTGGHGDGIAQARREAERILAEARTAALAARTDALEDLSLRQDSIDALEPLLAEDDRKLNERRRVFDEHRHSIKERRLALEEEQGALSARMTEATASIFAKAGLDHDVARRTVLERVEAELAVEHPDRVEAAITATTADPPGSARVAIVEAIERQSGSHADGAPRGTPVTLENLDDEARERLITALSTIAAGTATELGIDAERAQATLRGIDPVGREVARQAALEVVDRGLQAAEVGPLLLRTRASLATRVTSIGERAMWEMEMAGRPELAELVGTLHYRFSYGQNALLHCQETGHLCGVLAAELGMDQPTAREAGMMHDIGKAVDHDVEGSHAIIGGELLRLFGVDEGIVHAVKAHHFDEEPATDLAMLTICADAISASRPGARRDTLAAYLARLEQLQGIATRHKGVERAFPLQAGREMRVVVRARDVGDAQVPVLSAEIAREIEAEMQYPGMIRVVVIREMTATATAPAQVPVLAAVPSGGKAEPQAEPDTGG